MKIAVLLSGGVDSSVALKLLKDSGHDVTAFYLKIWLQDEFSFLGECPWEEDLNFVREVCKKENASLEILSLQTEYWDSVVTYTISEIKEGRTPNPDIFCNSLIKFGQFYDKIDSSFLKVASGHYAKIEKINGKFALKVSPDPIKDQTYFLSYLNQKQLARATFPLGNFVKSQVRDLAEKFDLPNKNRRDSQGICFLGQIKFNDFIKHHLGEKNGKILDYDTGKKLGEHKGYYYYTIGQRSGLGLSGGPWYVVEKNIEENLIYVSSENKSYREKETFFVTKLNWILESEPEDKNLKIKIRHGKHYNDCSIKFESKNLIKVKLNRKDKGIAPGQFAVFYKNDLCLGGGVIK
jgi:tRNA (5-methylaminomethyl-2-thiouridylate)-methyltransferase